MTYASPDGMAQEYSLSLGAWKKSWERDLGSSGSGFPFPSSGADGLRRVGLVLLHVLLLSFLGSSLYGQSVDLGPRLGLDVNNGSRLLIGVDGRIQWPNLPVIINPTLDYHFIEGGGFGDFFGNSVELDFTLWQVGVKGLYPFTLEDSDIQPYAGGGVILTRIAVDGQVTIQGQIIEDDSDSDSNLGLALTGGAVFPVGQLMLFTQGDLILSSSYELFGSETRGGDFALLTAGLLFRL